MNKLIVIGYLGIKTCYLNITESEAIERYCKDNSMSSTDYEENNNLTIDSYDFDDEFYAYDIWI